MKRKRIKKKSLLILIILIIGLVFVLNSCFHKSSKDIKLNKLGNVDKEVSYFKYDYLDRYIDYKNKHKSLSNKDIVMEVNIGIDHKYYTHTKKSINLNTPVVLVNKYNYLGSNYIPKNLKNINLKYSRRGMKLVNYAKTAFEDMAKAAAKKKYSIVAMSSYRGYKYQVNLYEKYKKKDGKDAADKYSARPGFSEHQTGLAVDVYNGKIDFNNFEKTKEFKWMQKNAYKYGFILRFPKDKEKLTGYQYESWHYRYVGRKIAKYIHDHNLSLEEYYVKKIED